ncbi:unnamed protein product [Paramecium sonneborni]|uniref:Uncharacterized protein n=1 Tax=Paramecium sonneborni TaxID=65129 RepID=A0A8S1QVT9_9CILI|nr:unnamed protein product [Paramecium sonneborni]
MHIQSPFVELGSIQKLVLQVVQTVTLEQVKQFLGHAIHQPEAFVYTFVQFLKEFQYVVSVDQYQKYPGKHYVQVYYDGHNAQPILHLLQKGLKCQQQYVLVDYQILLFYKKKSQLKQQPFVHQVHAPLFQSIVKHPFIEMHILPIKVYPELHLVHAIDINLSENYISEHPVVITNCTYSIINVWTRHTTLSTPKRSNFALWRCQSCGTQGESCFEIIDPKEALAIQFSDGFALQTNQFSNINEQILLLKDRHIINKNYQQLMINLIVITNHQQDRNHRHIQNNHNFLNLKHNLHFTNRNHLYNQYKHCLVMHIIYNHINMISIIHLINSIHQYKQSKQLHPNNSNNTSNALICSFVIANITLLTILNSWASAQITISNTFLTNLI